MIFGADTSSPRIVPVGDVFLMAQIRHSQRIYPSFSDKPSMVYNPFHATIENEEIRPNKCTCQVERSKGRGSQASDAHQAEGRGGKGGGPPEFLALETQPESPERSVRTPVNPTRV
jgi:hypothetical protein